MSCTHQGAGYTEWQREQLAARLAHSLCFLESQMVDDDLWLAKGMIRGARRWLDRVAGTQHALAHGGRSAMCGSARCPNNGR